MTATTNACAMGEAVRAPNRVVLQRLATTTDPARQRLYWHGDAQAVTQDTRTTALRGTPGTAVDLGTWFNAAPIGWWRDILGPGTCTVTVRGQGVATLVVLAAQGAPEQTLTGRIDDGWTVTVPAGAVWAWLRCLPAEPDLHAVVESVEWVLEHDGGPDASIGDAGDTTVTVVMPTFRREQDCLAQLDRLLGPELDDTVGRVVVIDQGGGTLRSTEGFAEIAERSGDRLVLCEQANLGGSGGYARGMAASVAWPEDPVLNLDDDAEIDPEVLRRLVRLSAAASRAGRPVLLGTGLLSAEEPTSLQALSEAVDRRRFHWGPADGLRPGADVARTGPSGWSFAAPSDRAEYSGWWGTMLPAGAVARLGLPAPYFIKWDDAEYGLRAGRAGLRVATLPGTGVWHPTWAAKGTISSWSAWPLHRNRLATALSYGAGRGVAVDSLIHQVKHLASMQYVTADLWDAAIREVLDGPSWLLADLSEVRPRAQAVIDEAAGRGPQSRPRRGVRTLPGVADYTWRAGLGRAGVRFTDGSAPLVRDVPRAVRAFLRTAGLHARLLTHWGSLRRHHHDALMEASTAKAWSRRF